VLQIVQIIASFMQKRHLRDVTGDPWDGRTLEWATASPPPAYNFSIIPTADKRDAFWEMKQKGIAPPKYEDIHMPKNTAAGIYVSIFAFLGSFAFVWHIMWLAVASIIGMIVVMIVRGFDEHSEYTIPAEEVERMERDRRQKALAADPVKVHEADMGLIEFIKIVLKFFWDVLRNKRWQAWRK